ncbi:MAG: glycoside hydrolase family 43 protein [Clostridiales bacterium]|nr:glycoside hydrolase family 43 protein [Clostridiales bacterium]
MKKIFSLTLSLILIFTIFNFSTSANAADIYSNNDNARVSVHDPSIVKGDDGKYYVFGSHIASAYSDDLIDWYSTSSTMTDDIYSYLSPNSISWKENCAKALEWTDIYQEVMGYDEDDWESNCWAADVIYNEAMGKWCLYACCSVWGTTQSVIFLATSDTIDGDYTFVDTMIYSGFTSANYVSKELDKKKYNYTHTNMVEVLGEDYCNTYIKNKTDGYFTSTYTYNCSYGEYPNCIDPTAFTDEDGNMWMVYGSYSGGCYVVPLVEETGLIDWDYMAENTSNGYDIYFGKQISKTCADNEGTGEGPFIVYDAESDYYYFYLTYGGLAGDGGYNIREYRSKNPDGPYEDKAGNLATDQTNTGVKLDGNYYFSSCSSAYLSGGHSSSFVDDDGKMYQAYHTRFYEDSGWGHQLRVHQMLRTSDGWAVMLPYEYEGETVSETGYDTSEIVGTYEFVNSTNMTQRLESGADLSSIVLPTTTIELAADGNIYGIVEYGYSLTNANTSQTAVSGTWSETEGTYYATFVINGVTYNGVFCKQYDESESKEEVMTFAALGTNNCEIWGVQIDNHTPTVTTKVTSPTCTEQGYTTATCSTCGRTYTYSYTSALGHKYTSTVVSPTCTAKGYTLHTCSRCKTSYKDTYTSALGHNYKSTVTKATLSKNGKIVTSCSRSGCTASKSTTTIYYPKTIKLSSTSYTYDGEKHKPSVTVKDSKGNKLTLNEDYTVSYSNSRSKSVGTYTVKIKFKGNYSGTKTLTYTIKPKSTKISKITAKSKGFTVKWKKQSTQTTGYQIQYSTSSKFSNAKTVTISKTGTTSKTISKLKSKKKYYVRVRTYKTVDGKKYYSSWSSTKTVTTKK